MIIIMIERNMNHIHLFYLCVDFVPTVIPLLQARNLDVGPRRSKVFSRHANHQSPTSQFINQLFNHQQVSSNNVPSILSNSNNPFTSSALPNDVDRASSINHHVALNPQVHLNQNFLFYALQTLIKSYKRLETPMTMYSLLVLA